MRKKDDRSPISRAEKCRSVHKRRESKRPLSCQSSLKAKLKQNLNQMNPNNLTVLVMTLNDPNELLDVLGILPSNFKRFSNISPLASTAVNSK